VTVAKKVMTIDDSAAIRELVKITLTPKGYEVAQASDGKQALDVLANFVPDMIICDYNMPHMGGIEFVRTVKDSEAYKAYNQIPIVMLTSETSEQRRTEGQLAGAKAWMVKPFRGDRLLAVVEKIIGSA